ncbi:MAG: 6,7-dimethyl-8-ribityllumazine synthase [Chromatiales bacterium]
MGDIITIAGQALLDPPARFGIIASRFNSFIVEKLVSGCVETLHRHGVLERDITLVNVPGAWETPLIAKTMAASAKFDALIVLGAIIRGATAHFERIAAGCANGLAEVSLGSSIPVVFGVLTVETVEQAIERAGGKAGNRGADAALTAIEMISLMRKLRL